MPALAHQKCFEHSYREASSQCLQCKRYFCRECVVEHAGKLLCASCLAKITDSREHRRERLAGAWRVAGTLAGVLALWLALYGLGALLLKIPPEFHDGTIWKKVRDESAP